MSEAASPSNTRGGYSAGMTVRDHRAVPIDTSVTAHERQIAALVAMGPQQRVRLAASMTDDVRQLALDGQSTQYHDQTGLRDDWSARQDRPPELVDEDVDVGLRCPVGGD